MLIKMKIPGFLLACICTLIVTAQDKLVVMGKAPDYYVVHATSGNESLQNISNQFGLSVAKLSSYNRININPNTPFAKGTQIKIPITKDNLLQHPSEYSAPIIHIVGKGDNLFRLSTAYYKVPLVSLREWNRLTTDAVNNGQEIIIGYMVNANTVITGNKKIEAPKDIPAILQNPVASPLTMAEDPAKKYTDKKQPPAPSPVKSDGPAATLTPEVLTTSNTSVAEKKPTKIEKQTVASVPTEYIPKEGDEGFFASGYLEHEAAQTQQFRSGDAAIFKTISGWTDRKFYVLMNDVAPKTVIRITGTSNKSICAMVLGPLQETKGASGLLLRLSNSAAAALGLIDPKFTVTITYFE